MAGTKGQRYEVTPDILGEILNAIEARGGVDEYEMARAVEVDRTTIQRLLQGLTASTPHLPAVYRFLGLDFTPGSELRQTKKVPLVGYVGAGAMYYPDPAVGPWGAIEYVDPPPGGHGYQAVRVRGDSMVPRYEDGDVLYFKRVAGVWDSDECNGSYCIVQLRNGPAYVKRMEFKGGRWRLLSLNPQTPTIEDADVEWASPVAWHQQLPKSAKKV